MTNLPAKSQAVVCCKIRVSQTLLSSSATTGERVLLTLPLAQFTINSFKYIKSKFRHCPEKFPLNRREPFRCLWHIKSRLSCEVKVSVTLKSIGSLCPELKVGSVSELLISKNYGHESASSRRKPTWRLLTTTNIIVALLIL